MSAATSLPAPDAEPPSESSTPAPPVTFRIEGPVILKNEKPPEEPRTRWQNLKAFFNSALGIWFLSSIVVDGLGAGISSHQATRRAEEERAERLRRTEVELRWRLQALYTKLDSDHAVFLFHRLGGRSGPAPTEAMGVFPEFVGRSAEGVYAERCSLLPRRCSPSFEEFAEAAFAYRLLAMTPGGIASPQGARPNPDEWPLQTLRAAALEVGLTIAIENALKDAIQQQLKNSVENK
jgi:hypothetical protein